MADWTLFERHGTVEWLSSSDGELLIRDSESGAEVRTTMPINEYR